MSLDRTAAVPIRIVDGFVPMGLGHSRVDPQRGPRGCEMSNGLFAPAAVTARYRSDGSVVVASQRRLERYSPSVLESFLMGCERHPDRVLVAERINGEWDRCTWGEAGIRVERLAQGFLDNSVAGRPVMILSHNSIAHLIVTLAAYVVASPVVPVSVAYSLQTNDYDKLRVMVGLVDPAAILAEDATYASALDAVGGHRLLLSADSREAGLTPIEQIEAAPTDAIAERICRVGADSLAKIMFTSGSTGTPKGVLNNHGMLSANQQQIRQVWPFLTEEPPILVDWLPWSHTFGGNHNVNMVLVNGGSLWIDDGRPTPQLIDRTVRNVADVRPTVYFNVPAGYAALVPILEREPSIAERFFSRLRLAFFASSALPQQLWDRLEAVAARQGSDMRMTTSWGMTETAPAATTTHFQVTRSDSIGVPLPGVELKLVPTGGKQELLVRGPNVTPGFYKRPDLEEIVFDSEGFLRSGDAVRLVDPADPNQGLLFDGRIAEDFKLSTGSFVSVGTLRPKLISVCGGVVQDAVICGHDGDFVCAMVWLHPDHANRRTSEGIPDDDLRCELADALRRLAELGGGATQRVERLLILTEPARLERGEITDKGYVNQRAVRETRADLVDELKGHVPSARTICRLRAAD